MSNLKEEFKASLNYVKNSNNDFKPSNELKLQMYALFKQATAGDVSGKKPGMMDFVNRAKYNAWEALKGLTKEQAMQGYIDRIEEVKSQSGDS